jgi:hypothetical protein
MPYGMIRLRTEALLYFPAVQQGHSNPLPVASRPRAQGRQAQAPEAARQQELPHSGGSISLLPSRPWSSAYGRWRGRVGVCGRCRYLSLGHPVPGPDGGGLGTDRPSRSRRIAKCAIVTALTTSMRTVGGPTTTALSCRSNVRRRATEVSAE